MRPSKIFSTAVFLPTILLLSSWNFTQYKADFKNNSRLESILGSPFTLPNVAQTHNTLSVAGVNSSISELNSVQPALTSVGVPLTTVVGTIIVPTEPAFYAHPVDSCPPANASGLVEKTHSQVNYSQPIETQPVYYSGINISQPSEYQTQYRPVVSTFGCSESTAQNSTAHSTKPAPRIGLLEYRRMMRSGQTPHPSELVGSWKGVNTGIATVAIDKQFIKRFSVVGSQVYGDNVSVPQSRSRQLPWRSKHSSHAHIAKKSRGKFMVEPAGGRGAFRHGLRLNYRAGDNRPLDPANLIHDRVVKLDDNRMLGRATVKIGPLQIPVAYFVLERISN
jgi:hypothetical protein